MEANTDAEKNNLPISDPQAEKLEGEQQPPLQLDNIIMEPEENGHVSEVLSLGGIMANQLDVKNDIPKLHHKPGVSLSFQVYADLSQSGESSNQQDWRSKSVELDWKITIDTNDNSEEHRFLSIEKKWAFCIVCKLGLNYDQVMKAFQYIRNLPSGIDRENMIEKAIIYVVEGSQAEQKSESISNSRSRLVVKIGANEVPKNEIQVIVQEDEGPACEICYESIPESHFKQPLPCKHTFCHNCYIHYFNEKISTNQVLDVKCPDDGCPYKFDDDKQIEQLLPEKKFQEFIQFRKNKILNQNPNLRWCVKPGCGKYAIGKSGDEKVVCECGTQICFECRNEYHPKKTCEQMLDHAYKEYLVKFDVQKCPRCKFGVEKIDGCNHMRCGVCNYEWCWLCGGKYNKTHFLILNPLGCGGLQSRRFTRSKWPCWKIYLWRILQLFLAIFIIALIPLAWAIFSTLVPNLLDEQMTRRRRRNKGRLDIKFYAVKILLIIVGLIFLPIWMLVSLITGIMLLVQGIRKYMRRRRRLRGY